MAQFQIPLAEGSQTFSITLGDYQCKVSVIYREADVGGWFIDVERTDGSAAVYGLPLVTGVDLLAQHKHLGLGGLSVQWSGGGMEYPSFEDMGKTVTVLWDDGNG
jgi:hypothetical protein